jgi:parallel beta-helix repeat protein
LHLNVIARIKFPPRGFESSSVIEREFGITHTNATGNSYGIYLYSSNGNNIIYNNASGNGYYGIDLSYYSDGNNITYNQIIHNINYDIETESSGNCIHHNNFIDNNGGSRQGYDDIGNNYWNETGEGNYWSDYDTPEEGCVDNDLNGICDAPLAIDGGLSQDMHPLTNQVPPVPEVSGSLILVIVSLILICITATRKRSIP